MKPVKAKIVKSLNHGARIHVCDNSGAKIIRLMSVKGEKTVKGRMPSAGIGDMIKAHVISGSPEVMKQVVDAIIVRQKKEYRRPDGMRIKFEDNAAVLLKDDKGTPKGTILKGPIAKEATSRWPGIAKVAGIIV